ncbi:MAG TPA: sucrase ferredoxin [Trueperaceae bacterium]
MTEAGGNGFQLCNLFARGQGLDPIGYAGTLDAFLAFEVPLPWPRGIFESRSKLPAEAREALEWFQRELPFRLRSLVIGPDPQYSQPGMRRVVWWARPDGPMSEYGSAEYLVPQESMGQLVAALVRSGGRAEDFADYRTEAHGRNLLVCTHGTQDAACGRFGVPLYRRLRSRAGEAGCRVWRVSHFGGHLFAPTLLELPSGRLWAYLEDDSAELLLEERGDADELRDKYRGWAALEGPFLQALERELLAREGWEWLRLPKSGRTIEQDPSADPRWALVELTVWRDRGVEVHTARVEVDGFLDVRPRSDSQEVKPYAQYRVASLSLTEGTASDVQAVA